ncbi:MAG: GspE/PulE family protein [Acidobacteriota bacterium]
MAEYLVRCWNCLGEYDALTAVWCSCNPNRPTKVCPFCLQCFCSAPEEFHETFWSQAPEGLRTDREMLARARGPLGEALIRAKAITSEQLLEALKRQSQEGGRLGEILVALGHLTQETLDAFLASQRSVTQVSLKDSPPDPMLVAAVGAEECLRRMVVPISRETLSGRNLLTLAMANPSDGETIEFVQNATGCQVLALQASREEIAAFLAPFQGGSAAPAADPEPAARLATDLIRKAISRGASDLYVEPREDEVSIHLRIDGFLYKAKPVARDLRDVLTTELKRLLRLDTSISDRPQSNRVVMRSGDQRYEVIAHSLPTRSGENLSLKIINRDTFLKSYDQLGIPPEDQKILRAALSAQRGLVLLSAPLFHGCTTTLYAVMNDLASEGTRKIVSIEAQSVCPVPNVSQISLGDNHDAEATVTTMKALSSIQPDVCIVADLLDSGAMASQIQKLMGQVLVVATLEAPGTVKALLGAMAAGISPQELAQNLLLVLNQRLIRRNCPACSAPLPLSENTLRMMGLSEEEARELTGCQQGQGCPECSGIGYRGRLALFEILSPTPVFRKALAKGPAEKTLEREALKSGMVPLRQRALEAIEKGLTGPEEFRKEAF